MAYNTGRVYMECEFYYGLDHGLTSMWDDDGQLFYQTEYNHGVLVNTIVDNRPVE
ncbi:MAG: hypothetical protein M0D57_21425 [Sphingobacteriales bacterium JAD_PAG50586_3]|nr:MAG: hypothetical protein M0D57_21425 [Sphingobacteriales bacterium JAD_PAG50586_3]